MVSFCELNQLSLMTNNSKKKKKNSFDVHIAIHVTFCV